MVFTDASAAQPKLHEVDATDCRKQVAEFASVRITSVILQSLLVTQDDLSDARKRATVRDDPSRGTTWRSDISPKKLPDFDIPHHRDRQ